MKIITILMMVVLLVSFVMAGNDTSPIKPIEDLPKDDPKPELPPVEVKPIAYNVEYLPEKQPYYPINVTAESAEDALDNGKIEIDKDTVFVTFWSNRFTLTDISEKIIDESVYNRQEVICTYDGCKFAEYKSYVKDSLQSKKVDLLSKYIQMLK